MNSKTRKILFLACFLAFITLCPILLAHSLGFSFDFNNKKIVPTGSISIKSIPKKSKIYINEELFSLETPAYINNLKEGEYNIRIAKEGFSEWKKILNVKNYQLTIADNVLLLPANPESRQIFSGNIQWIEFSPSGKKAAILTSESDLYLLDLSIPQSPIVSRVDNKHILVSISQPSLQWQASEAGFSVFAAINSGQKGYFLLSSSGDPQLLAKIKNPSESFSMWHKENSDIFIFLDDAKIYQLNISNRASVELASDAQNYVAIENKTLYIQKKSGLIYSVSDPWTTLSPGLKFTDQFTKTPIPSFSADKNYSLFELSEKEILIKDSDSSLFIAKNQEIKQLSQKISGFDISPSKNNILIFDSHEINIINKNSDDYPKELVSRTEQTIKKALWFDDAHIAYLLSDGSFYITELDSRNGRNILTPLSDKIDDFWINCDKNLDFPIMNYVSNDRLFRINWNNPPL